MSGGAMGGGAMGGGAMGGAAAGGRRLARSVLTAALAAGAARAGYAWLSRRPPGGPARWTRTNHRGEAVTLLAGPAVAAAAAAAAATAPGLTPRARAALIAAGAGAGAIGCYDDLAGSGGPRGFRGHLGALAAGELTTGTIKLAGIGATGLAASAVLGRAGAAGGSGRGAGGRIADLVINAGLIAGGANLINLFDLRPGRAAKVALAFGGLLAAGRAPGPQAAAVPTGAVAALIGEDLGERAMLGDAGANAVGAMLGTAAAAGLPRPARLAVLALTAGLTAASEKVSFTAVIERTPVLHRLDMLGRRPAAAAGGPVPDQPGPGGAARRAHDEPTAPAPAVTSDGTGPGGPSASAASA